MKMLNLTLVVLLLSGGLFAQESTPNCGTISRTKEQKEQLRHYGNNRMLIGVLNKHGFDIPSDYFNKIDNNGLYKGRVISRKKRDNKGNGTGGRAAFSGGVTYVPIAIHIYKNNAGTLASSFANVHEVFAEMVTIFRNNESSIVPYIKTIGTSPYTEYYDLDDSDDNNMWNDTKDNNAYNVHIINSHIPKAGGTAVAGRAQLGGKSQFLVSSTGLNPITFAHELGHNFNLEHTHDGGLWHANNGDSNNCDQEPVSRTRTNRFGCLGIFKKKCETNGDELCDTPGDPVSNISSCINPGGTDNWGDAWNPDLSNIMAYTNCRSTFSLGQIGVMLDELDTRSFVSYSTPYSVTGPSRLCQGSVGSYSSSYANTSIWDVPDGWEILSGQGTTTITARAGFNNGYVVVVPYGAAVIAKSVTSVSQSGGLFVSGASSVSDDGFGKNYYVTMVSGASYNWSVPSGWSITYGQGTSSIIATPYSGASSGYVEALIGVCGTSYNVYKYVTITGGGPLDPQRLEKPLDDDFSKIDFKVYPNPVKDDIFIKHNGREQYKYDVRIIEIETGKEVLNQSCLEHNASIKVATLQPSLYVMIITIGGESKTYKFIKE